MHKAAVFGCGCPHTVVAFCATLIGGGGGGSEAEITASVPAGVHWRAVPM